MIMDHTYVEQHGLVERYHRGRLPPDEEASFEEHFAGCPRCLEQLELDLGLERGLKALAAEEGARTAVRAGVLAWLARRHPGVQAVWAAAVVALAAGLPALWLAGRAAAPEERSPWVNTPVYVLSAYRGAPGEPAATIGLGAAGDLLSLAVDVDDDPRVASYRATLESAGHDLLWSGSDLRPNALETLLITFRRDVFEPGEYRFTLEGLDATGSRVTEPRGYTLRVE